MFLFVFVHIIYNVTIYIYMHIYIYSFIMFTYICVCMFSDRVVCVLRDCVWMHTSHPLNSQSFRKGPFRQAGNVTPAMVSAMCSNSRGITSTIKKI